MQYEPNAIPASAETTESASVPLFGGVPHDRDPLSTLARMLRIVTEVRPSEVATALLLTLDSFLLLSAYSCIKPVREALILSLPSGAEYKIYMAAATAVTLLLAMPLYAKVAARLTRNRLLTWVTSFFASHLLVFYALGSAFGPSRILGLSFYVWIGVFNMMIVAQFWAFSNDIYSEEAGHRLFPLLGLGASVGAVAGSATAKELIRRLGSLPLLLVAAALLLVSAVVVEIVHKRETRRFQTGPVQSSAASPIGGSGHDAFRLVFHNRYLRLIAVFSLLFTLVKTNGDYVLAKLVADTARNGALHGTFSAQAAGEYIGGFYANFNFYVDVVSLILQAVIVSRLVKYAGLGLAFFVLPALAFLDAGAMSVLPLLSIVKFGKVAESATDYSLNNTVRNMLWLPTTRRAKYIAKQTVDTFFVRMGDVVSAVLVFSGIQSLSWGIRGFALCNLLLTVIWIWLARRIVLEPAKSDASIAMGGDV